MVLDYGTLGEEYQPMKFKQRDKRTNGEREGGFREELVCQMSI